MNAASEKLDRGILLSVVLHVGFFALIVASPVLFPFGSASNWGSANGGDGIKVNIVGSAAGLALPSPAVSTPDAAANESKGFYQSQPAPPAPPPPADAKVEKIPDPKAKAVKTPPPVKSAAPAQEASNAKTTVPSKTPPPKAPAKTPAPPVPDNAIPFGQGGRPDVGYGSFQTGKGAMGMKFGGDGAFGTQFGPYVQGMQRRIQQNWLQGMIDPSIAHAPRVYVTFDILRDGTLTNFQIQQSSGIPALDRSAQRAILASSPLQPLPSGFSGSRVSVTFYFEYVR
jgi:TonB family protein